MENLNIEQYKGMKNVGFINIYFWNLKKTH